jgi:hypothetical protein
MKLLVSVSSPAALSRRAFLRNSASAAVPLALIAAGLPLTAAAYAPPSRQRGSAVRNVKNYGAVGNGSHNDTAAFQSAIKSLPSAGGTVYVPAGTYMIDAVKSVHLRSYMFLKLDPDARLVAIPNSASRYSVLTADMIHDVEIAGGRITGERDKHKGTSGEGGHGIVVKGCARMTIRDILISKGWGDGISVGPHARYQQRFVYSTDIVVANVVCTGNRRNGLSITNVIGMKVYDSEFSNTHGTKPQCGIDVEPNKDIDGSGYNDKVHIENCVMKGNAAYGVNVWNRSRNLTITRCSITGNKSCGIVTTGLRGGTFTANSIHSNTKTGLHIQTGTTNLSVSGGTFYDNYLLQGNVARAAFYLVGVNSKIAKDLIRGTGTSGISIGKNYYK